MHRLFLRNQKLTVTIQRRCTITLYCTSGIRNIRSNKHAFDLVWTGCNAVSDWEGRSWLYPDLYPVSPGYVQKYVSRFTGVFLNFLVFLLRELLYGYYCFATDKSSSVVETNIVKKYCLRLITYDWFYRF